MWQVNRQETSHFLLRPPYIDWIFITTFFYGYSKNTKPVLTHFIVKKPYLQLTNSQPSISGEKNQIKSPGNQKIWNCSRMLNSFYVLSWFPNATFLLFILFYSLPLSISFYQPFFLILVSRSKTGKYSCTLRKYLK